MSNPTLTEPAAIVLVTTSFPICSDGSEAAGVFVADLAEALSAHRPVRVVAPGKAAGSETWSEGVEVFRYAAPSKPLSTIRPWWPADLGHLFRVVRGGLAATRDAVSAGATVHVLALWALPSGHWARLAANEAGIPYSVWTLGSDIWTLGRVPIVRSQLRRVLRDAHACFADGLQLAEDTRRIGGREVEFKPSTRRIGVRRSVPVRAQPPYRLLFIGRWHPNKGVDLLLEALGLLDDSDWARIESVAIFGGGPLAPQVGSGVLALQAAQRPVSLGGYLDTAAAEKQMLCADFMLIPSRIESIPVVFSDAMKVGCPVLACPVGDLPQLVSEGPCGRVARNVSARAYADLLADVLASASAAGYRDGVEAMAGRFSVERIAAGIASSLGGRDDG